MRPGKPRQEAFSPRRLPPVVTEHPPSLQGPVQGKPDKEVELARQEEAKVKQGELKIVYMGIRLPQRRFPKTP